MSRETIVDRYCSGWNAADAGRRGAILEPIWADGATYTDPTVHVVGITALIEHIGRVLEKYPGSRVVRTSGVDTHHSVARFGWRMVLADGSRLPDSVDFVEFSGPEAIRRVVGFFGPLPEGDPTR